MIRLFFTTALLIVTAPASADWQGTKWGQSLDLTLERDRTVIVPRHQRAMDRLSTGDEPQARGRHEIAGVWTNATYYFRDEGLSQIRITISSNADTAAIERALLDVYGTPARQNSRGSFCVDASDVWLDREQGNSIEYLRSGCNGSMDLYELIIAPIATADSSGL